MREISMSEDLRRQRRNLLVSSLILCFMKYGGITINKISVLGVEIVLTNVSVIYLSLWLVWFYFSFRYYQYFMQEGVNKIKGSFIDVMNNKCKVRLKKIVSSAHPNFYRNNQQFDYNILCMKKPNWYTILFLGHEGTQNNEPSGFKMNIKMWLLWKEIFSSCSHMVINKSVISDYLFPIIFAVFAVIYCNISEWPGQITNFF